MIHYLHIIGKTLNVSVFVVLVPEWEGSNDDIETSAQPRLLFILDPHMRALELSFIVLVMLH